jgi:sec-independent protein translocase protein TatA
MFGSLGFAEILVIGLIAVVIFGGSRMADLGKGLGDGVRNFKRALRAGSEDDEK